jgi:hypothetical protein
MALRGVGQRAERLLAALLLLLCACGLVVAQSAEVLTQGGNIVLVVNDPSARVFLATKDQVQRGQATAPGQELINSVRPPRRLLIPADSR